MKKYYLLSLALLTALSAGAKHLSPQEAASRALAQPGMMRAPGQAPRLVYSQGEEVYVFNQAETFFIAPADDKARPVLGYCDEGAFDVNNIPPQLQWLLEQYAEELKLNSAELINESGEPAKAPARAAIHDLYAGWQPIAPLVTTKWNQDAPYNAETPNGNCATGCVATAMAQIVFYNKYYIGSGSKQYTTKTNKYEIDYTFPAAMNFSAMTNTYDDNSTEESKAAVASLMKACGVAVEMNYTTGASGASSSNVPLGLVQYMGYNPAQTAYTRRDHYNTSEWESLIYSQLSAAHPVFYSGQAPGGGHAFVCDGYDKNGLFHFNWGWGGNSDGYFALSSLNPDDQGIGSFPGGYNGFQGIVTVASPKSTDTAVAPSISAYINYSGENQGKATFKYGFRSTNNSSKLYTSLGLGIVDSKGELRYSTVLRSNSMFQASEYGLSNQSATPTINYSAFEPGNYKYVIIWKQLDENGNVISDWQVCQHLAPDLNEVNFTITEDLNRVVSEFSNKGRIELAQLPQEKVFANTASSISPVFINPGAIDYFGSVYMRVTDSEGEIVATDNITYTTVPVGDAIPIEFNVNALPAGSYYCNFYSDEEFTNEFSSTSFGLPIVSDTSEQVELTLANVENLNSCPSKLMKGDIWRFSPIVQTYSSIPLWLTIKFYKHGTDENFYTYVDNGYYDLGTGRYYLGGPSLTISLPIGLYDIQFGHYTSDVAFTPISQKHTLYVGDVVDGFGVMPQDDGSLAIASADGLSGDLVVPATISGMNVTAINSQAFANNDQITSLTLPASIKSIGHNALRNCRGIQYVIMNSGVRPFLDANLVNYGMHPDAAWYVDEENYNAHASAFGNATLYKHIKSLNNFPHPEYFFNTWSADFQVQVTPRMDVNPNFHVELVSSEPAVKNDEPKNAPALYADSNQPVASMEVGELDNLGVLHLNVHGNLPGTASYLVTSDAPGAKNILVPINVKDIQTEVKAIVLDFDTVKYFDMQGNELPSLPDTPGIYLEVRPDGKVNKIIR